MSYAYVAKSRIKWKTKMYFDQADLDFGTLWKLYNVLFYFLPRDNAKSALYV